MFETPQKKEAIPTDAIFGSVQSVMHDQRHARGRGPSLQEEVDQAKAEAKVLGHAEGTKAGFEAGRAAGLIAGKQQAHQEAMAQYSGEIKKFQAALEQKLAEIDEAVVRWGVEAEQSMTGLAMEIVTELLHTELKTSRESALEIVKEALKEIPHSTGVRIRMNPVDASLVKERQAELLTAVGALKNIEFVEDEGIVGGCVIEAGGGLVDARAETALSALHVELGGAA